MRFDKYGGSALRSSRLFMKKMGRLRHDIRTSFWISCVSDWFVGSHMAALQDACPVTTRESGRDPYMHVLLFKISEWHLKTKNSSAWAASIGHWMWKTLCDIEPQRWLERITSCDAKSACFKGSKTSHNVTILTTIIIVDFCRFLRYWWLKYHYTQKDDQINSKTISVR